MADHDFRCGDIVRCVSPYYAEQLRIAGQDGIVMGTKPHHIHVWYESQKRGFWITYDILRRIAEASVTPLLERIQSISYMLNAEEWELEENAEVHRLICYVDEESLETLIELRAYLDIEYKTLALKPEGMGRMIAQVEWLKE